AIVTDIPGTTRDLLKVDLLVKGMAVRLVDTAGLRDSDDEIEKIGVAKAIKQAKLADLILVIIDADQLPPDEWEKHISGLLISIEPDIPIIIVMNKVDLLGPDRPVNSHINEYPVFWISAKQSSGLEQLKDGILQILGVTPSETIFIARARHLEALDDALHHLMLSRKEIIGHQAIEIMAEELNLAHQSLGEIVGAVTPDDLLGRIFSEFCIGK
ncbi:MAG: GTP-binding protein, partial [Pseudomonadales bacterium]|nr:GTP-binding protein [Pseudomonadales bacterium]